MSDATWKAVSLAVWGVLAAMIACALALIRSGLLGRSITPMLVAMVRQTAVRVILLVGWAWLGWHLFAR